jgi:hypothetical protein
MTESKIIESLNADRVYLKIKAIFRGLLMNEESEFLFNIEINPIKASYFII